MSRQDIWDALKAGIGDHWMEIVVPPKPSTVWEVAGVFPISTSVTPSIDASASGHWHGFITDGECR